MNGRTRRAGNFSLFALCCACAAPAWAVDVGVVGLFPGKAVLVISSDIDEVLGLSHRAYLVRRGRIAGEVRPDHTDKDRVLRRLFQTEDTSDAERETA